ncbi:MAG: cupin protein [Thermoleophilia bacterium]|nr:cupin protein [Thermoleophilia bacterium]
MNDARFDTHIPTPSAAGGRTRTAAHRKSQSTAPTRPKLPGIDSLDDDARLTIREPLRRWVGGGELRQGWRSPEAVAIEFCMRPLWVAAPVGHRHPHSSETIHVLSGRLGVSIDGVRSVHDAGSRVIVPAGARHNLWNAGARNLHLVDVWRPAMRMDELYECIFRVGIPLRASPRQLASVLWGYPAEIRWSPRRRSLATAALAIAGITLAARASASVRKRR